MSPPAPGLFSITTDWPQTSCRRLPTRRAVVSVEPPGANGTTMRTVFAGQSAAEARDTTMDGAATAAAARPTKRRRFSMALPPEVTARVVMFFAECGDRLRQNQCGPSDNCHHPRMRVIQYSRDASDETEGPRRTGYPAFAGYDDWEDGDIRPPYSLSSSLSLPPGVT